MAEPMFSSDDDLPRTLRRERDARERDLRERELREQEAHARDMAARELAAREMAARDRVESLGPDPRHDRAAPVGGPDYGGWDAGATGGGVVRRLEIPFAHLMFFFLKAVIAAIPALIVLTVLLIAGGQMLKYAVPGLRQFEIVVRTPVAMVPPLAPSNREPARAAPTPPGTPAKR